MIVMAGRSISLPCSSRADNDLRWDFYTPGWDKPKSIYNGLGFTWRRQIKFDYDSCRLKICYLNITSVQLEDAGYYICFEASRPKRIGVSLVVLATEPTCSLNISLPGNGVHESDFIEINCTVEYKGSWTPNVSCVPDAPVQLVDEETHKFQFRQLSYIRVVAAADLRDRANITCETTFFRSDAETSIPTVDKILTDTPRYHHTWQSSPINVTTESAWSKRTTVNRNFTVAATTTKWSILVAGTSVAFVTGLMIVLLVALLVICCLVIIVLVLCRRRRTRNKTVVRRVLPEVPLTTLTTSTTASSRQQQQQHQTTFQTRSSTAFDDDGHYTDVHFNVGGAARIPTWRQSFADDPGHYNYLEFNQPNDSGTVEQRRRSRATGYEGLDAATLRQPQGPSHYTGIGGSRTDPDGYLEPVEQPENGNNSSVADQLQQQAGPRDLSASGSDSVLQTSQQQRGDANRQGYQGLDPSAVEQLRRPPRLHSYAGIGTQSADRSGVHSYLELIGYSAINGQLDGEVTAAAKGYEGLDPAEVVELRRTRRPHPYAAFETSSSADRSGVVTGYSGTNNEGDHGPTAKGYEGLDPVEVEEWRRRANRPHDYAGLADGDGDNTGREVVPASAGYEGLDPVQVEESRRRARRPRKYAGLRR